MAKLNSFGYLVLILMRVFASFAAKYDENYAKQMLAFSAGAYAVSPEDCIRRAMSSINKWTLFSSGSENCDALNNLCSFYIAISDYRREIIVVFRGTRSKIQLMVEGLSSMQPGADFYGIGKVNEYFYHGLKALWKGVKNVLSRHQYKEYSVTFTGHSLGGALASLAAIKTVLDKLRKSSQVKLYTFGQPRVGCSSFAFEHDKLVPHSFRIVNQKDIVPHLPPCSNNLLHQASLPCDPSTSGIAYHHGQEVWYKDGMNSSAPTYRLCKGKPHNEDFKCSDQLMFHLFKYGTYFADHRHYFGHKVPAFGKLGCEIGNPLEELLPNDAITATDVPLPHQSMMHKMVDRAKKLGNILKGLF